MTTLEMILTIVTLSVQVGTLVGLIFALFKFLNKPHDTLEQRVALLEAQMKDSDRDKVRLTDRCREQDETNEVLIHSVMALIEFEIQYCLTEKKEVSKDLENARLALHHYLAKK